MISPTISTCLQYENGHRRTYSKRTGQQIHKKLVQMTFHKKAKESQCPVRWRKANSTRYYWIFLQPQHLLNRFLSFFAYNFKLLFSPFLFLNIYAVFKSIGKVFSSLHALTCCFYYLSLKISFWRCFFILLNYVDLQKTCLNCRICYSNNTHATTCYICNYSIHSKTAQKDRKYQFLKIGYRILKKGRSSKKLPAQNSG